MTIDIIGYIGMILVLVTLFLTRTHYRVSQVVSIFGGLFLIIYAILINALPNILLNLIWVIISTYNLFKIRK